MVRVVHLAPQVMEGEISNSNNATSDEALFLTGQPSPMMVS